MKVLQNDKQLYQVSLTLETKDYYVGVSTRVEAPDMAGAMDAAWNRIEVRLSNPQERLRVIKNEILDARIVSKTIINHEAAFEDYMNLALRTGHRYSREIHLAEEPYLFIEVVR